MKFKAIVVLGLVCVFASHGFSQQSTKEVELQTDTSNPASKKAKVIVSPDYTTDPDGSGLDAWTARDTGLVGRWDFEDTASSGPFVDSSTYNNAMTLTAGASQADGVSKSVFLNGGSNFHTTLTDNPSVNTGEITLSFWFKLNSGSLNGSLYATLCHINEYFLSDYTMVIAASKVSGQYYLTVRHCEWQPIGNIKVCYPTFFRSSALPSASSGNTLWLNYAVAPLDNGQWNQLVFTYDRSDSNGTITVYLNGAKLSPSGSDIHIVSASEKLKGKEVQFGFVTTNNTGNPLHYLNGNIDRIRLYNREISAAEVTLLSNQNADGDAVTDRNELLQSSSPLDPNDPAPESDGNSVVRDDDQNQNPNLPGLGEMYGRWDFEAYDANSCIEDLTSNDNDLELVGGVSLDSTIAMPSRSISLDGSGYLRDTNINNWGDVEEYTASMWVRINKQTLKTSSWQNLFTLDGVYSGASSTKKSLHLVLRNLLTGGTFIELLGSSVLGDANPQLVIFRSWNVSYTEALDDDQWHHIALVREGVLGSFNYQYELYVDGVSLGKQSDIINTKFDGNNKSLYVGGFSDPVLNFKIKPLQGHIDRLRFYQQDLSASQVAGLYTQDWDGDNIPDQVEIAAGLNPLEVNSPPAADPMWDEDNLASNLTDDLLAHWNFESFTYNSSGAFLANQQSPGTYDLEPSVGLVLGESNAIASKYALFRGADSASADLGDALSGKDDFSIAAWVKIKRDSIFGVTGIPTPIFEIHDAFTGGGYDSLRAFAQRAGLITHVYVTRFDNSAAARDDSSTMYYRWTLLPSKRLDDENWHHLVILRESNGSGTNEFKLYLDGEQVTGTVQEGTLDIQGASNMGAYLDGSAKVFNIGTMQRGADPSPTTFGLDGCIDRLRLYDIALDQSKITALYKHDADADGVIDRDEYVIPGRSAINASDSGSLPAGEFASVDLLGVLPSLNSDASLVGFWDFENLETSPSLGFDDWTANDKIMVPHGAPDAIGIDSAVGMPSRSVFINGHAHLEADGSPMLDAEEFSVSMWLRTDPGILSTQVGGISIISFEDMQSWKNANTLNLSAVRSNTVKSITLGLYDSNTGILKNAGSLASWPTGNIEIDNGQWHHVTWVRRKSGSLVYLDGVQLEKNPQFTEIVSKLTTTNMPGASPRVVLGRIAVNSPLNGFRGNIDRLRLYKKALSVSEVTSLFFQDYDGDGFSDLFELGRLGFDALNAATAGNATDGATEDFDGETGLAGASALKNGLKGAWDFETVAPSLPGDARSSLRFPAQYPLSLDGALATVNARWDRHQGMLSRSLTLARDSMVAFPASIWDRQDKVSASFWVRMDQGSIDAHTGQMEVSENVIGLKDKIALLTFGQSRTALPGFILSVNGEHQLVLESGFAYAAPNDLIGFTAQRLLRTSSPAKLDDGRWHHIVLNIDSDISGNNSTIHVDGKLAVNLSTPFNYAFSTGSVAEANDPYLWIGFKKNLRPDDGNFLVSEMPYTGFDGNLDRVRFYDRNLSLTEIENLYHQDYDGDTIWDVTEVNGTTDPVTSDPVNGADDLDGDGLSKTEEDALGTEWRDPDSDGDWLLDGWEDFYSTGPDSFRPMRDDSTARNQNQDFDSLTGWQEFLAGTNPDAADTDGDGYNDDLEQEKGSDPLLASSIPDTDASGTAMNPGPSGGQLPGGAYQANINDGIARAITYNGSDATGPRHRKIALNGRPIADEAPEEESETDQHKEEMYVDAFNLGLHYDTSLVYVPVPSSRLKLQATLSLREASWSHRSGIRPNEQITNPFGPCWSSNLCAYVQEITTSNDFNYDSSKPAVTYSVIDEDGRGLRFGSYDGRKIFAYPSSLTDRRSYTHELGKTADGKLVLRKKHGTVVTYELTTLKQSHRANRAGASGTYITNRFYRLTTVRDRYGNELRYVYPGGTKHTLIPAKITDTNPARKDLVLRITLVPGNPHRIQSVTDPRGHTHTFSYSPLAVPNGIASATASADNMLAGITDPYGKTLNYNYQAVTDKEVTSSEITHHYHINLSSIKDKRGVVSKITYRPDDARYTTTAGFNATYARIHGLPRLVRKVETAAQNTANLGDNTNVARTANFLRRGGIRWIYGPNGVTITSGAGSFVPTRDWFNEITDAQGNKTTYCFRDIKARATNVTNHGSSLSLNWMVYYLQMDIILPGGLDTETYKFDLASGLNVASSKDLSGNETHYQYGDSWGGFSIIPSSANLANHAVFSRWSDPTSKTDALGRVQQYTYSQHFRAMSSHKDVLGTLRTFIVDTLGRRTSLEARDKAGTLLRRETYKYENAQFPAFMTAQRVEAYTNLSDHSWEKPIITLRVADTQGRVLHQGIDLNQNGNLEPGTDIVTSYTYDANNNKITTTDPRRNTTDFIYDKLNRLSRVTYPSAEGTNRDIRAFKILLYDPNSNKHAEQDEEGNFSIIIRDALNRTTISIRDMDGIGIPTFTVEATADGQQAYKLTAEGSEGTADITSHSTYNAVDSLTHITDPRGTVAYTEYDAIQRPIRIWANWTPGSTLASFSTATDKILTELYYEISKNTGGSIFNKDGFKPTTTITRNAIATSAEIYEDITLEQEYDKVYRPILTRLTHDGGKTTISTTAYNDPARTVTSTVALGEINEKTTHSQMDGLGRVTQVTNGYGSALTATAQTFYTSTGLAWKAIDPEGREAETDFDTAGRAVKAWSPDPLAKVVNRTAVNVPGGSPVIETLYDLNSNVTATINPLGEQWDFAFDKRNRPYEQKLPAVTDAGNPAAPVANQRPTTTIHFNKVGKPTAVQDARGHWSRSFYDRAYRVTFTRVNPSTGSPSSQPDPLANLAFDIVTSTTFDKNSNPLRVTDGNGNITRNQFDALNRQAVTSVNPSSGNPVDPNTSGYNPATYQIAGITGDIVTTTLYDDAGNVIRITDGQGRTIDYRFDGLKRKTKTIWDIGATLARTEILVYDSVLQTSRIDANGRVTDYGYDSLHRLTSIDYPSRTQDNRTYSYDLANNLLEVTYLNETAPNKLRRNCATSYDALNRVISEISNEVDTTTSFDKAGNILTKVYGQTNRTITSVYDVLNRLSTCTEGSRITTYAYDLNGNITRKTLPNAQYTDKTFDKINRTIKSLTKTMLGVLLVSTDSTAAVAPYANGYDNVGSLIKTTEQYAHGSVKNRILTNSYDKAYRLTNEILDQNVAGGTVKTTAYQYDRSNNRHRKTVTTGAAVTSDHGHTYGDGNNGANSNQLKSFGPFGGSSTHTFSYDANGSRLTMMANGRTDTYLYDDEKRLVSLDYQTDTNAAKRGIHLYQYDHRTRRVTRNESAVTGGTDTRLVFADGLSIQEHNGGTITSSPTVEYIRGSDYGGGIGGVLYTLRGGIPRYNAYNYRGDVTTTTDSNAAINWQAAYEAFGTRPQEAGTNPERQRANTKSEDPTGLLNEGMRYRDLLTGTFITRDPLGIVDGPNEYTYTVQNPWSKFDPDGLATMATTDGVSSSTEDQISKKEVKEKKGFLDGYSDMASARRTARRQHKKNIVARWKASGKTQTNGPLKHEIYNFTSEERASIAYKLGEEAEQHGFHDVKEQMWKHYRDKHDEAYTKQVRWALIDGFVTAGMALADGPLPFGDALAVGRGVNASTKGGRVFWSGSDEAHAAATAFAKKTGGMTLEMTRTGKFLDTITTRKTYPLLKPLWNAASKRFAKGSGQTVDVFHSMNKGVRLKSVWAGKEYPQLMKQGTKVNYHSAP